MKKLIFLILLISSISYSQVPFIAGRTNPFDTSAQRYFASMTIQLPDDIKLAINSFVLSMKAITLSNGNTMYANFDKFHILALANYQQAFTPLKGDTALTLVGYREDFVAWQGLRNTLGGIVNTGTYLNLNYTPNNSGNYKISSTAASMGFYSVTEASATVTGNDMGAKSTSGDIKYDIFNIKQYDSRLYGLIGGSDGIWNSSYTASSIGLFTLTKSGTALTVYKGDSAIKTGTSSNTDFSMHSWALGDCPLNGNAQMASDRLYSLVYAGGYMNASDVNKFDSITTILLTAINTYLYTQNIVCVGNSLTESFAYGILNTYPTQLQALNSQRIANVGVSGRTIATMITQYPNNVAPYYTAGKNNIVVLWGGTIELGTTSDSAVVARLKAFTDLAKATGFKVAVCTILPTVLSGTANLSLSTAIRNASAYFDAVIDVQSITELQNASDTTYFYDGTHLTALGNSLIANKVYLTTKNL